MKFEEGKVTSLKMAKTAVIEIAYTIKDKKYKKIIRKTKKLLADIGSNKLNEGDKVRIQEVKPISKSKNWRIVQIIK